MLRKILPTLAFSLLVIPGIAQELVEGGRSQRVDCPAPCPAKPCCSPPPACCWNFNPCNPKYCTDMDGNGFYFSAEFLYWTAENHGFSYAYEIKTPTPIEPDSGAVIRISPNWDPGFRIGLGWNTNYDFCDVFLNYTWYRNFSSETRISSVGFIPLWPVTIAAGTEYNSVSAASRHLLNIGDLEIGRWIYLTKSISMRPHLGARGGGIRQQFSDSFQGLVLGGSEPVVDFLGIHNYWGVGPRAGVDGELHLNYGFSLLGQASGALLYGKSIAYSISRFLPTGVPLFVTNRSYSDVFYQLVPNLQLSVGFQWQTCFGCEKLLFKTSAAWEANCWFNLFALPYGLFDNIAVTSSNINFPLTLEGLTAKFELDF